MDDLIYARRDIYADRNMSQTEYIKSDICTERNMFSCELHAWNFADSREGSVAVAAMVGGWSAGTHAVAAKLRAAITYIPHNMRMYLMCMCGLHMYVSAAVYISAAVTVYVIRKRNQDTYTGYRI